MDSLWAAVPPPSAGRGRYGARAWLFSLDRELAALAERDPTLIRP
ncbi:hypothetical protein [Micromonospora sp. U56]|nr:hypothetical protein [Micromonospora sp. U56]